MAHLQIYDGVAYYAEKLDLTPPGTTRGTMLLPSELREVMFDDANGEISSFCAESEEFGTFMGNAKIITDDDKTVIGAIVNMSDRVVDLYDASTDRVTRYGCKSIQSLGKKSLHVFKQKTPTDWVRATGIFKNIYAKCVLVIHTGTDNTVRVSMNVHIENTGNLPFTVDSIEVVSTPRMAEHFASKRVFGPIKVNYHGPDSLYIIRKDTYLHTSVMLNAWTSTLEKPVKYFMSLDDKHPKVHYGYTFDESELGKMVPCEVHLVGNDRTTKRVFDTTFKSGDLSLGELDHDVEATCLTVATNDAKTTFKFSYTIKIVSHQNDPFELIVKHAFKGTYSGYQNFVPECTKDGVQWKFTVNHKNNTFKGTITYCIW